MSTGMGCSGAGLLVVLALAACGGKVDPDGTGAGKSGQSAGQADPSASASASGSASPGGTTKPACALATPIHEDFESAFPSGAEWGAANPIGLKLDSSKPISGAQSLRITIGGLVQQRSYATRSDLSSSCGGNLSFKLRVDTLFASGNATIVRLGAPPTFFDVVLESSGEVSVVESSNGSRPGGGAIGRVDAGVTATVSVSLDFKTKTLVRSLASVGKPPPEPGASPITTSPGDLRSLAVGLFDSTAPAGSSYWIDEFDLQ